MYGIVLTENNLVKGYAVACLPKIKVATLYAMRIDKGRRRHGYGTLMLNHFFAALTVWDKLFIEIDIDERNEGARQFLMREDMSGFVITAISEHFDEEGWPKRAFWQMQYPAPYGFRPHNINIVRDGKKIDRVFQKRP